MLVDFSINVVSRHQSASQLSSRFHSPARYYSSPNPRQGLPRRLDRSQSRSILISRAAYKIKKTRSTYRTTIFEPAETLSSTNLRASLLQPRHIKDGAHQHRANCNDCNLGACRCPPNGHDGSLVLAEDIENTWLVDSLWVDSVVCAWDVDDIFYGAGDRGVPSVIVL